MNAFSALCSPDCFRTSIVQRIFAKGPELEHWFTQRELSVPLPPYTSIDLRDSGFKAVPVDSNAFPGGFNNICADDWPVAAMQFARVLSQSGKKPKRIILVPENHTNNLYYFENLRALREILVLAGFDTVVRHLNPNLPDNYGEGLSTVTTQSGHTLLLERLEREGDRFVTKRTQFEPTDIVLLNNDLSNGVLPALEGLVHPVMPSTNMGWFQRKKGTHLKFYCELAAEAAQILEIDPFLITARFSEVNEIDFDTGKGIDRVAREVDALIQQLRDDYASRSIDSEPFVFVKDNSGTYGRAIMPVKSGAELLQLNRREKNKMSVGKGGATVDSVLLMEGIPTDLSVNQETAEPVIYLAGHMPIGGFLRLNPNKDKQGNLNAPGAHFKTLCFANLFRNPNQQAVVLEKFYGMLGRLSSLANAHEMLRFTSEE